MTKSQIIQLLVAVGVGFAGRSAIDFKGGANPSATIIHALRIEAPLLPDGGLGEDKITAFRTVATPELDGGLDLQDIGPANCAGDTRSVRTWIRNSCPTDGGSVQRVRVIEARPAATTDDGGTPSISVEVYGDTTERCVLDKPAALNNFLESLTCVGAKSRARVNAL